MIQVVTTGDPPIPLPQDAIEALCRRWKIVRLALFGSVLCDDFGPESDVDVLVQFAEDAQPRVFEPSDLSVELSEALGAPLD